MTEKELVEELVGPVSKRFEVKVKGTKCVYIAYGDSAQVARETVQKFLEVERADLKNFHLMVKEVPFSEDEPIRYDANPQPGGHQYQEPKK